MRTIIEDLEEEKMNEELKPCPFCGSKARLVHTLDDEWYVECSQCDSEGGGFCSCLPSTWLYGTKQEAIEAWNRRAKDEWR